MCNVLERNVGNDSCARPQKNPTWHARFALKKSAWSVWKHVTMDSNATKWIDLKYLTPSFNHHIHEWIVWNNDIVELINNLILTINNSHMSSIRSWLKTRNGWTRNVRIVRKPTRMMTAWNVWNVNAAHDSARFAIPNSRFASAIGTKHWNQEQDNTIRMEDRLNRRAFGLVQARLQRIFQLALHRKTT